MAKLTTEEFIAAIKELSVLELNDLVKACEEEFGVSAAAGVVVAAAGAAEAAEEKDEEIRTDDVEDNFRQDDKRLTDEDKRELMAPVDSEPDPEFVTAMTFEDISNVAEVLMSENPDEQKAIRAASTIHHKMQETVILSFLTDKLSNQEKVNQLLSECLDDTGRPLARRKSTSKKKEAFDIGKFV